jgi:acetate kinase
MATVLAVNAGSSSLKFAAFAPGEPPRRRLSGKVERIGRSDATLALDGGEGRQVAAPDHAAALPLVVDALASRRLVVEAVEHRIVHGGPRFLAPAQVSPELLDELRRISPFDPEHLPAGIALIEACSRRFPGLPRVACFDTAFHRDLPRVSRLLPIPRKYEAEGIRRYGFHGLSYAYLTRALGREPGGLPARLVIAHLGNGASVAAIRDGKSVDTTMAFTPTAGVPMSRRSGDLDPGLVAYLARSEGMTPEQFHDMVNSRSGLLGISETSSDVQDLLAREGADVRAAEALSVFCYHVRKTIGAYAAALGGLDALVFSGGIGENAVVIRARVCDGLAFLGIALDPARNADHASVISAGRVTVRVMRTDEEVEIARSTWEVLGGGHAGNP